MHAELLQELFEELSPALVLYARQWCDCPDDAVQETFIDLSNTVENPKCPKAWLFTTAKRKAINLTRSEVRRRRHHQQLNEQVTYQDHPDNWFRSNATSELYSEDVIAGLDKMESSEREMLVARIWGNLKYEQLAELFGCSTSSAHRRYITALSNLKAIMSSSEDSESTVSAQRSHTKTNELEN